MFHRISHSSSESPIESEIEMEPPADQLRRMAFDRRNKNWLEESWNLIDTIAVSYTHLTLPTNREV